MGIADTAAGICAYLNLPGGATGTTTVESSTRFLRAVRSGSVHAIARPLRAGRSIIVIQTDTGAGETVGVRDSAVDLVAVACEQLDPERFGEREDRLEIWRVSGLAHG